MRAGLAGAVLAGLIGAAPAVAQDALIVKSTVAEYRVGTKIKADTKIVLESGDVISVLVKGGTRTMRGPGSFVAGAEPKNNRMRFANLTRKNAAAKDGTGGVRAPSADGEGRPPNPNIYYIDVDRSGPICLRDLDEVVFWRPYNVEAATYTLSEVAPEDTGQTLSLTIPFGTQSDLGFIDVNSFALKDKTSYTIAGPDGVKGAAITIIDLGGDIRAADELGDALIENGCMTQFEILADRLTPDD